jgi:outer membrane protein insertion porin family
MRRAAAILVVLAAAGCASRPDTKDPDAFEPSFPYRFEGNAAVASKQLIEAAKPELRSFETKGHHAADLDDAAYAMRRWLRREGHAHSKVTVRMEPSPEQVAAATFVIEEGPRTRWGTIVFPGAQAQGEAALRQLFVFEKKKAGLLAQEEPPPPFRQTDLEAGIARVASVYLGEGYYRVKVGPPKIAWSADRTVADVTVPVEENRRYVVASVEVVFDGSPDSEEGIRATARSFQGGAYHPRVAVRAAVAVRAELAEEGRVRARVDPSAAVDDATATAVVTLKIRPGPKIRVARVSVQGNERTREGFVLDRARLEAGSLLTGKDLDRAVENLYGTGLFKSVRVAPVVPAGVESRVESRAESRASGDDAYDAYDAEVAIAVEELLARSVDFEVGWGSYELLRGAIRYRDRNLFGIGRDIELEPAASLKSVGADARFFDRYLLGPDNRLEVLTGFLLREEPSFDLTAFRAEVAVRHTFSEQLTGRAGYRFVASNANDLAVVDLVDDDSAIAAGPFATLEYDARDNPILPTKGFFIDTGVALSSSVFGGNVDFVDLYAQASAYRRLGEGTVLAGTIRAQTRHVLDGADTLPLPLRLFLGGANDVRSFGESELGPSDANGDPLGGLTALNATIELRQRLMGDLHGAVFYDVGTVGEDSFDLANGYGSAIGVGLRYYLPMGPIRLDVGYNPGARFAADSDVAVHFSFGFSF